MSHDIEAQLIEKSSVPEGAFDAFGTARPGGNQFFSRPVTPPAPDEVGGDPCPDCGAAEWWIWLDGSRLCRRGVIQGDHLGRLLEQELKRADAVPDRESGEDHGHDAAVGTVDRVTQGTAGVWHTGGLDAEAIKVGSAWSIDFHAVYDRTIITDFLSACRVWEGSQDISRRYDQRTHADIYSFRASATIALVGYLLTSATCFTAEERSHRAGTILWQLKHGVTGGAYTPHQDPKAPSVLATQMPLFEPTSATTVSAN